jgi:hypothetical protein
MTTFKSNLERWDDDEHPLPLSPATKRKLERYLRKRFLIAPGTGLEDMCRAHPEAVEAWLQEGADKAKRKAEVAAHEYAYAEVTLALLWTWAEDERAKGRPESELMFGNCLRELDVVVDGRLVLERRLDWTDRLRRLRATRDPSTYSAIVTAAADEFDRRFGSRQ